MFERNFKFVLLLASSIGFSVSNLTALRDMGLINKVDMVCLSPVGYGV